MQRHMYLSNFESVRKFWLKERFPIIFVLLFPVVPLESRKSLRMVKAIYKAEEKE